MFRVDEILRPPGGVFGRDEIVHRNDARFDATPFFLDATRVCVGKFDSKRSTKSGGSFIVGIGLRRGLPDRLKSRASGHPGPEQDALRAPESSIDVNLLQRPAPG